MSKQGKKELGGICVFWNMSYPEIRGMVVIESSDKSDWNTLWIPGGTEYHAYDEELTQLDCLSSEEFEELRTASPESRKALIEKIWMVHGPRIIAEIATRTFVKPS